MLMILVILYAYITLIIIVHLTNETIGVLYHTLPGFKVHIFSPSLSPRELSDYPSSSFNSLYYNALIPLVLLYVYVILFFYVMVVVVFVGLFNRVSTDHGRWILFIPLILL